MSTSLQDPPAQLPDLQPSDIRTIPAGTTLCRIYNRLGEHTSRPDQLRGWGPLPTARFDHHPEPPRDHGFITATGYYAIEDSSPATAGQELIAMNSPLITAVAETFQAARTVVISDSQALAIMDLSIEVTVLDLSSGWATRAGAGNHLSTGPHTTTRRWARAIHAAYPRLVGMCWTSSVHPPGVALVLTERGANSRGIVPVHLNYDDPLDGPTTSRLLTHIRMMIGYGLT